MTKWVYLYNEVKQAEKAVGGSWDAVKGLVGGKGSGLLDMTRAGVPVPPFFYRDHRSVQRISQGWEIPQGYVGSGTGCDETGGKEDGQEIW